MAGIKSLAKDTAIYGLSSIVGRFLNYLLVPLYTAVLPAASGGYGVVSNVYAYTALILVLLTFGMETGFFRFANKSDEDAGKVYANSLLFVGGLSLLFVVLCMVFLHPLSALLEYPDHPDYIAMMVCVVALDSFQCIPFAYLRYKKRPIKFASIKLLNIVGNILLNLFFLLVCPWLNVHAPETVNWFYNPDYLVGYIFVSNLIMSALQMFFFIPELRGILSHGQGADEAHGKLFFPDIDIWAGRYPEPDGRQDDLSLSVRRPFGRVGAAGYIQCHE